MVVNLNLGNIIHNYTPLVKSVIPSLHLPSDPIPHLVKVLDEIMERLGPEVAIPIQVLKQYVGNTGKLVDVEMDPTANFAHLIVELKDNPLLKDTLKETLPPHGGLCLRGFVNRFVMLAERVRDGS